MVYNQNNSFRFNNGRKNFDNPKNDDFNSNNNTMYKKAKRKNHGLSTAIFQL